MTKVQRIKELIAGIITAVIAVLLILIPNGTYSLIIYMIGITFIIRGAGALLYFIFMARFMVGGRASLYMGMIMLNFGMLTLTLSDVPHYYILLYLVGIHGFEGLVDILRALEEKRFGAGSWKLKLSHGVFDIGIAVICLIMMGNMYVTVIIYGIGLFYSSVMHFVSAFRRSRFIYIQ